MLLADAIVLDPLSATGLLLGAGGVIGLLFRLLMTSKDREFALLSAQKDKYASDLESVKKSYQEIAAEALKSALDTANYYRQREGKAPIIPTAPVISESHSPSTPEQREAALVATMRAVMAKVKLITGQPPREEPPKAPDEALSPDVKQGVIEVLKHSISEVPERTAEMVVEKLEEQKEKER